MCDLFADVVVFWPHPHTLAYMNQYTQRCKHMCRVLSLSHTHTQTLCTSFLSQRYHIQELSFIHSNLHTYLGWH